MVGGSRAALAQNLGTAPQAKMTVCANGQVQGWGGSFLFGQPTSTAGPVLVHSAILSNVAAIVPGSQFGECAYAIDKCGTLYAWGDNNHGKLGLGSVASVAVPTAVTIPGQRRVSQVAPGENFALAVCTDGTAWAWGLNNVGQLGIGTTGGPDELSPVQVHTSGIIQVQAGESFGLALRATGKVLSWGLDTYGELGRNLPSGTMSPTPTPLNSLVGGGGVAIETMGRFTAGVVQADGSVYCWGRNHTYSLGNGGTSDTAVPTQALPAGSGAIALAGSEFSVTAQLANGQTRVWGYNDTGLFGICNGPSASLSPIAGPALPANSRIFCVATDATACITPSGQVLYWGWGGLPYSGSGGSGNASFSCTPTPLPNSYPAVPNAGPLPAYQPVALNTTAATLCAGSSVVLQASGGNGVSYSWAPNIGLSATSGATVVVAPGSTQQYTVTSVNACGLTASATVAVTVKENCCQQADGYDLNVQGVYTSSPFQGRPGTRYLATGDLTLTTDTYRLVTGETLLMGRDNVLTVGTNAELLLTGATITADCDGMWGRLRVASDARGLRTESVASLPSRIQHCQQGVVLDESPQSAYFQLKGTEFLHNGVSLALHRATAPATSSDHVVGCRFDSTPEFFKVPLAYQSPTAYRYTQHHLYLAGNLQPATFVENSFRHCLFGVFGSQVDGEASSIDLRKGDFADCYLAAAYNATNPGYAPTWSFDGNAFVFPAGAALPNTQQLRDQQPRVSQNGRAETYGIWVGNQAQARATRNTFAAAPNSPARQTTKYSQIGAVNPRQVGIHGNTLPVLEGNTFDTLETGVEQTVYPYDQTSLQGNVFRECRVGWDLLPVGDPWNTPTGRPTPVLNATCNSFVRDAARDGVSTGIHIQRYFIPYNQPGGGYANFYPVVRLDDPNGQLGPNRTPLKNLFDNAGRAPSNFIAVHNEQGGAALDYFTYFDYFGTVQNYSVGNITPNGGPTRNVGDPRNATCEFVLGYPNVGLQTRGVNTNGQPIAASNGLAQNWPNPCAGTTAFRYTTKAGSKQAELLIRRATDGREATRITLNAQATEAAVSVAGWPAGTYFATLVVDGVPGVTRRMVVE